MLNGTDRKRCSFTIVEMLVSATVLVIAISVLVPLLIFAVTCYHKSRAMAELDTKAFIAREWIKQDIRASSADEITMWPAGSYTSLGVSFPVIRRGPNASGPPLNDDGEIDWTHTVNYHLYWNAEKELVELRRTVFAPRDNSLSSYERLLQLYYSYIYGDGKANPHNGDNAVTQVLISDLKNYRITSESAEIDTYGSPHSRMLYHIGTWILNPGVHYARFTSTGVNDLSTGQGLGLDQITTSATGDPYDLECLLPAYSHAGATPEAESMIQYTGWGNSAQALFPADSDGDQVTFQIYNDMWLESTFDHQNAVVDNAKVAYNGEIGENVCEMQGNDVAWESYVQTLGAEISADTATNYADATVRVVIGGADAEVGGNIAYSGRRGRVTFMAAPGDDGGVLEITSAYIMERNKRYDGDEATKVQLTFADASSKSGVTVFNNQTSIRLAKGVWASSDVFDLAIDPDKDYLVSYHVSADLGEHTPAVWTDSNSRTHAYMIAGDTANNSGAADWDSLTGVTIDSLTKIPGVESLFVTYPTSATYTSRILDTRMADPDYEWVKWRESTPTGTGISIRARSGDQPDLSDAVDWSSAPVFSVANGANSLSTIAGGRYVQWQAVFTTSDPYDQTARLRDVTIRWPGERRGVDVVVGAEQDTDRGKFALTIDGSAPSPAALRMEFVARSRTFGGTYEKGFVAAGTPHNE